MAPSINTCSQPMVFVIEGHTIFIWMYVTMTTIYFNLIDIFLLKYTYFIPVKEFFMYTLLLLKIPKYFTYYNIISNYVFFLSNGSDQTFISEIFS